MHFQSKLLLNTKEYLSLILIYSGPFVVRSFVEYSDGYVADGCMCGFMDRDLNEMC